jgi:hypothetical protein
VIGCLTTSTVNGQQTIACHPESSYCLLSFNDQRDCTDCTVAVQDEKSVKSVSVDF